jgi:hypothetical protein
MLVAPKGTGRQVPGSPLTLALVVLACITAACATVRSTASRHWDAGPRLMMPLNWEVIGNEKGATPFAYVDLVRHPVATTRGWPDALRRGFLHNDALELEQSFPQERACLMVIETKTDPFPGRVSSSLADASGLIRRSWAPNHRIIVIGYFGPDVGRSVLLAADKITVSAKPEQSSTGGYVAVATVDPNRTL